MIKLIIYSIFLIFSVKVFAENIGDLYFYENFKNYENKNMYDLDVYLVDTNKKHKKLTTFGYFGDNPKVNFYFFQKIKSINRIFISTYLYTDQYEYKPKYIYKDGKYNFMTVFDCSGLNCKKNEKLSDFFGEGADLVEVKKDQVVAEYSYASIEKTKKEVESKFFRNWLNGNLKNGTVKQKTDIYESNGMNSRRIGYLIQGDHFKIKDVSSRWLNIQYIHKTGKVITGWIICADTTICSEKQP